MAAGVRSTSRRATVSDAPQTQIVAAQSRPSQPGVVPAFAGGQVAQGGRLGLLGNTDTMKSPFNMTSYTDKFIRDQQAATAADALILDPSVRSSHPTGGVLDSFNIRGFPVNEGNSGEFAFEGLYGIAPTYRIFTDYVERIEVLKGPSAALSGMAPNGGVGGVINVVPKRAEEDLTRLTASYGSTARFGGHWDVARRYGDGKEWGVRASGSLRGGDTPIDRQSEKAVRVVTTTRANANQVHAAVKNIFGDRGSFAGGWHVHEAVASFARTRRTPAPVVLGIDHGGVARAAELTPFSRSFDALIAAIVGELLPRVHARFELGYGPDFHFVAGSSLGGLAALYAHFLRPDVFGGAISMSPSLGFTTGFPAFVAAQPIPARSRIYLDVGKRERGRPLLEAFGKRLAARGWGRSPDLRLMVRPDARGHHDETSWRRRFPKALRFLLAA